MRILHLLSQTELTGSEAYAQTLTKDQTQRGHEIFVVSDNLHLEFPGTYKKLPIATSSFFRRLINIWQLRRYLVENKIEVVHCHSRAACRHLAWARTGLRVAMVTTLHGFQHRSFSKRLFNIYGDTVLAVCERIQEQLTGEFRVNPVSVQVLRNPIKLHWKNADPQRKTVALLGRASGPKGRRLMELFRSEIPAWLEINKELQVFAGLSGLGASDRTALLKSIAPAHHGRVQISGEHLDLNSVFDRSFAVVASGRIAIEAFARGCEVLALGESSFEGRLSEENLASCLGNNFGDVGPERVLDPASVTHHLRNILRSPMTVHSREKLQKAFEKEFSHEAICNRIEEIYRGARLLRVSPGLPILMYHKVPDQDVPSKHKIFVSRDNFEKHLMFFQSMGFQTLTFDDLKDFWFEKRPLEDFPARPLMLTFDDGYRDNLRNALPLLEQYKMKATLFVLADHTIIENTWDEKEPGVPADLITLDEKKQLPRTICGIGSHGLEHLHLPKLTDSEVLHQMTESKRRLEADLDRPACAFAYPFGDVDARLPKLAHQSGYDFAVNTDRGALRWTDDRHSMFRVNIFPHESWFSLWRKTSSWYRRSYFRKRGQ